MPTNRTRIRRPPKGGRFTPEVVTLFRRLLQFEREDGGCQREYRNVCARLDRLLGFDEPWDRFSPAHVQGDSEPPKWIREHEVADWERAIKVRRELEQAVANEPIEKMRQP
jgi:hypothetical protein